VSLTTFRDANIHVDDTPVLSDQLDLTFVRYYADEDENGDRMVSSRLNSISFRYFDSRVFFNTRLYSIGIDHKFS